MQPGARQALKPTLSVTLPVIVAIRALALRRARNALVHCCHAPCRRNCLPHSYSPQSPERQPSLRAKFPSNKSPWYRKSRFAIARYCVVVRRPLASGTSLAIGDAIQHTRPGKSWPTSSTATPETCLGPPFQRWAGRQISHSSLLS